MPNCVTCNLRVDSVGACQFELNGKPHVCTDALKSEMERHERLSNADTQIIADLNKRLSVANLQIRAYEELLQELDGHYDMTAHFMVERFRKVMIKSSGRCTGNHKHGCTDCFEQSLERDGKSLREPSVICKTCGMPADTVVPGGDVIKHRCY